MELEEKGNEEKKATRRKTNGIPIEKKAIPKVDTRSHAESHNNNTTRPQSHPHQPHKLCTTTPSPSPSPSQQNTGWSVILSDEESAIDAKTLAKFRAWFDRFHKAIVKEVSAPPAAAADGGGGADLFKLFLVVRRRGGRDAVTRGGLWESVACELGLGLEFAGAVKLVYANSCLAEFERWVDRGVEAVRELCLMNTPPGGVSRKRKSGSDEDGDEALAGLLRWVRGAARDPGDSSVGSLPEPSKWNCGADDGAGVWKKVLLAREALFLKRNNNDEHQLQKHQRMHPSMYTDKLGSAYNLRERQPTRRKLLNGKSDSHEVGLESSPATSDMDRSMSGSEDQNDKFEISDALYTMIYRCNRSRIPTGQAYQAQVPEWTGETSESDSKWLGQKVWPLDKSEQKYLIERDPIGKGRNDNPCGCMEPGSVECVRFHNAEKRLRVKLELSSAFYIWKFPKMGEDVRGFWDEADRKKFKKTISSNLSCDTENGYWAHIFKAFPSKTREDLVSYYYNVYILNRRAYQNRFTPDKIDSDDEEFEPASEINGDVGKETPDSRISILLTPNKQHRK